MQTSLSHSEDTDSKEATKTIPEAPSTSTPIIVDSIDESFVNENHLSPVFNENNKRPRVASPVVASASSSIGYCFITNRQPNSDSGHRRISTETSNV
jgi:hypothetical protein